MAWTPPKTWNYQDPLSFEDLNTYVRDNTDFLYHGIQYVVGQWSREQTALVSGLTAGSWNVIDSGGLTHITVGQVQSGDFIEIGACARCSNGASSNKWILGIWVYDSTTVLKKYTLPYASSGESVAAPIIFTPAQAYSDIQIFLAVYPYTSTGSLPLATAPEVYSWFYAVHKRPPTI